jgi:hypothetical protein
MLHYCTTGKSATGTTYFKEEANRTQQILCFRAYCGVMRHFETSTIEAQWIFGSLAYGWLEGNTGVR